jgi:hypothetical protein
MALMTNITQGIEKLSKLEQEFEITAQSRWFTPQYKFNVFNNIINDMLDVVIISAQANSGDSTDLAEYVADFLDRRDLARKYNDAAFGAPETKILKQKIEARIATALLDTALYLRPVEQHHLNMDLS